MCRIDENGVYMGNSQGVYCFDHSGTEKWNHTATNSVLFGVQDEDHLYVAGLNISKLSKKTGDLIQTYPLNHKSPPSNAVYSNTSSPKGQVEKEDNKEKEKEKEKEREKERTLVVSGQPPFEVFDGETGELLYRLKGNTSFLSMQFQRISTSNSTETTPEDQEDKKESTSLRLYGVRNGLFCIDLSPDRLKSLKDGQSITTKIIESSATVEEIKPSTEVETTSDTSGGIVVECMKEGGKVRVRVEKSQQKVGGGYYDTTWNVQFPQDLREVGARFIVEELKEQNGFYRAKGSIKRLA
eukprot:TRINITY_DN424_c0_g1_i2.p2 TRINITY_DN424_c0_g1~~TRINITY_DN424_c0_g1_i2.p2  ORF type:complete len:297 (+),score=87.39 TRINITY_DN424_c0_g1_i2:808-1698(+)